MILVTGCAGFIGSRVAKQLLERGDEVVGVDNLNDAYDLRIKHWRLAQLSGSTRFVFHPLDITDSQAVKALMRTHRFEAVINLAARAGVTASVAMPEAYLETNVTGTLNLLNACRDHNIQKFVLASTSSLYGDSERPFKECNPTDRPLSPYAASKKAAEALSYSYHHLYGIDTTILRYFTVYGPAGRPDMSIYRFIHWIARGEPVVIYGDGTQERDFTFVEDIARGTVAGLKRLGFEVINLGNDRPRSLLDVIALLERELGLEAEIRFESAHASDVPATWAHIARAEQLLGWRPETSLEEGLRATVNWRRENEGWLDEVPLP
ncbi:MAG: SDR family NAD(P)-dependent oxidoreductase [Chloroflexota bacterium]